MLYVSEIGSAKDDDDDDDVKRLEPAEKKSVVRLMCSATMRECKKCEVET